MKSEILNGAQKAASFAERSTPIDAFRPEKVLSEDAFGEITDLRINRPALIEQEARRRKRRARLTRDGRLVLVALDHPARGITQIRTDGLAMGDRYQLLARALRVLADTDLDGIVAPSDVMDELFLLSSIERRSKKSSFLDGRVLVGSMNRGGIAGAVFEMDDGFTSLTARRLASLRCDGGKMLYRLDLSDPASGRTILACSQALNELGRYRLAKFLEPLTVAFHEQERTTQTDIVSMVRQCGIASALGESSSHLWLKLPYCDDFARLGRATTVPILLLGGPPRKSAVETLDDFAKGLASSARVRGAIIGRNLLFPGDSDPLPMCRALTAIVHQGASTEEAMLLLQQSEYMGSVAPKGRHRRRR